MNDTSFNELSYFGRVRRLCLLAKSALSAYGLGDASIKLIKYRDNVTFQVDAPGNTSRNPKDSRYLRNRYLLRIHGLGYQTASSVASELKWLKALRRDTDLAVPEPVSTLGGTLLTEASVRSFPGNRVCSLLRWMKGRAYRNPRPDQLIAIGEVMAQLHNHAEGWSLPPDFTRRRLDWDGTLGKDSGFAVSPHEIWSSLPSDYADLFDAVSERVGQAMQDLGDGHEVFGLIHADLHTYNLLFAGGETRVLDFDDSGFGYHLYDMAVSLLTNGFPGRRDELFEGYARHRPVPYGQLEYLDTFIAARRLSDIAWPLGQLEGRLPSDANATRWLESTAKAFRMFLRKH